MEPVHSLLLRSANAVELALTSDTEVVRGVVTAIVTVVVVVVAAGVVGFVILFRRRGDRAIRQASPRSTSAIRVKADGLLLALDNAVRAADDELGFAIAQFGEAAAAPYAAAVAEARAELTEAFRLTQALDDAVPESEARRREWTLQVIARCERATATLAEQEAAFASRRSVEAHAGDAVARIRSAIADARARLAGATATVERLEAAYAPESVAMIAGNPAEAGRLLDDAERTVSAAEPRISPSGVNVVASELEQATRAGLRAQQLLDEVDAAASRLAESDAALDARIGEAKDDLVEAKRERDSAPDAETGAAIIRAIEAVESTLATVSKASGRRQPTAALDLLGAAIAELDTALAAARNQAQRLEHARVALAGAIVSAKSQIGEVHAFIGSRGGGVDARTRLAEAERQLALATVEADPVEALDIARRAITHARDADALARYHAR